MKVFLSHSGDRSQALALAFQKFIRRLIQSTDPWISTGIDKGSRWEPEIANNLEQSGVGIVCLTPENLDARWILFESGALSKRLGDKVCTVLLDVQPADVKPPLSQFQHTRPTRDDVFKLVQTINKAVEDAKEKPCPVDDLGDLFEKFWTDLEKAIIDLRAQAPARPPQRDQKEILTEVLDVVRELSRRPNMAGAEDKTLQLVKEIYRAVIRDEPPSLRALRQLAENPALRARVEETLRVSDPIRTGQVEPILPPERDSS